MKASEARELNEKSDKDYWHGVHKQAQEEAERRKKEDARYMKEEYPTFEYKIYNEIREAAGNRRKSIRVTSPNASAWEKLSKKLLSEDYKIYSHYVQGEYINYGDSDAPCYVWSPACWSYEVSW